MIIVENHLSKSIILCKIVKRREIMLHDILILIVGILIGAVIGFYGARTCMKSYLKKNEEIDEWKK